MLSRSREQQLAGTTFVGVAYARRHEDMGQLDLFRNPREAVAVRAVELLDFEPAHLKATELLLSQTLGEQLLPHIVSELAADTGQWHPVQFLEAGLRSHLLNTLLNDRIELLLYFLVGDRDAVLDRLCQDQLFGDHGFKDLLAKAGCVGVEAVVQDEELHLRVDLGQKDDLVVDHRGDLVERLLCGIPRREGAATREQAQGPDRQRCGTGRSSIPPRCVGDVWPGRRLHTGPEDSWTYCSYCWRRRSIIIRLRTSSRT